MSTNDISDSLRTFITRYIRSLRELEVLLLLAESNRDWTADVIGAQMYVDQTAAERILRELADAGLLVRNDGDPPSYRYNPGANDAAVRELATTYKHMRPRIVDLIYGTPNDDLESFSDAFRLRKGKD